MQLRRLKTLVVIAAAAGLAVSLVVAAPVLAGNPKNHAFPPTPTWWTGYNSHLDEYYVAPGYPPYDDHPRYLGVLRGSWYEIGHQYGEKAGDLIRLTYEGWYQEIIAIQGSNQNIVDYVHQQDAYYRTLVPEALEMMRGIADGAKEDLDGSLYAAAMTNYEKILMINSYFGLQGRPPATTSSATPAAASGAGDEYNCSGAVVFGNATKDGKLIHVSSEDQHFFPQEYLVAFIVKPSDPRAHSYTITDTAGEIGSEQAINDHGVVVSGYAGGGVDIRSPTAEAPFSGYRRAGLDWQVGDFYATAFASSAKEAVELLTVGRPEYREASGKKIVIGKCNKGANWVVSDKHEAYVVESIPADLNGVARYAVRRPGDKDEIGANYIVSTNQVEASYSCDEDNVCSAAHPMSQHGNSTQNPNFFGLSGSGQRFWTLMWLIHDNYGKIDLDMVKQWRTTHFFYDMGGTRHDTLDYKGSTYPTNLTPGAGVLCRHTVSSAFPGVDQFTGINIYVSISTPHDRTVYRTKGRPCEWVGPWDSLSLVAHGTP
jgi:hypothetical protein